MPSGRAWLEEVPGPERSRREALAGSSLRQARHALEKDLRAIPGFPGGAAPAPALH